MLRVEASNLPKPRGLPRPRRLLPLPPKPRRGEAASRHELLLPPADGDVAPETSLVLSEPKHPHLQERWSVKLELGDDEIAKLYGQGMTRGAVVWKKGMLEWRPLLITPELSGLLRRTRMTTLTETPSLPTLAQLAAPLDEPTLPRAARVPFEPPPELLEKPAVPSVAPTALDVEPSPNKPQARRPIELALVAVGAFVLAWLGHSALNPRTAAAPPPAPLAVIAPAAAAPACEPTAPAPVHTSSSAIPTIAVADLPLAGAKAASAAVLTSTIGGSNKAARSSVSGSSSNGRPSRSDLVAALGQVARAASSCGERGGPVRVVVSFANSGVARSVQVSGTDLPSTTRSCMIGAASRARVPAFSGDPVTVSKSLEGSSRNGV